MPLDEKDREEITKLLSTTLAGAIADPAFVKNIGTVVKTEVAGAVKGLDFDGKLKALEGKIPAPTDADDEPDPGAPQKKVKKEEDSPAFKRLQKQIEDTEARRKAAEDKATATEAKRAEESQAVAVRDAFLASGADPKRLGILMNHARASGLIKHDADGKPGFAFKDTWGETIKPLDEGARLWLATDEGKMFLPPTGGAGTGEKVGGASGKGPTQVSAQVILGRLLHAEGQR